MNIFSSNFLSRQPIDHAMRDFGQRFSPNQRVLDIGCGKKPYRQFFACEYVGVDSAASVKPDIVADAWNIPLKDESFDGIVLNQSLEHIAQTEKTVREIMRLLKPGGFAVVTVPHAMRTHSSPLPANQAPVHNFNPGDHRSWRVDYYRFTKFGLMYVFRDFETISITETSGYGGTLFQLSNYFLASLGPPWIFFPFYATNNLLGLTLDKIFSLLAATKIPLCVKFHEYVYLSLPVNYVCIFKKPSPRDGIL